METIFVDTVDEVLKHALRDASPALAPEAPRAAEALFPAEPPRAAAPPLKAPAAA
jgi:hypothetical protein